MRHVAYWAMTLATAVVGAGIVISRYAFAPSNAIWIMFALAIAATVFSIAATAVGLLRDDHSFLGASALSALIGGFTVIATRAFNGPTALWLALAGGIALLLVALRTLALNETTVELVVHQLEVDGPDSSMGATRRDGIEIDGTMRSWLYWFSHTAIALAGAFVVASTFIWRHPTAQVSPRWLAFGVGIAAASIALGALADRALDEYRSGLSAERLAAIAVTALAVGAAGALIATMAVVTSSYNVRWTAFALGAGMVGVSLVASIIHELTTERVRHELEIAHRTGAGEVVSAAR
jgi:hypothetical protein